MSNGNIKSPYSFHKRKAFINKKYQNNLQRTEPISHASLKDDRYDIAFEIQWQNLTPVAVNPCSAMDVPPSPIDREGKDFAGYDKRWLMIDDKLAISPFTVKSAIANGFANLMGACYRVNKNIEGHRDLERGQYPYGGKYKRYRVSMDDVSKPGIIKSIRKLNSEDEYSDVEIEIQPVCEYYSNTNLSTPLAKHENVKIRIIQDRGLKPPVVEILKEADEISGIYQAKYYGTYKYGMNLSNPKGNKYKHRLYIEHGDCIRGIIKKENFFDLNRMKKIVYLGGKDQNNKNIPLWFEDLSKDIEQDSFVYFVSFGDRVTNIGKNFLFKALFSIDDAIPEGYSACDNPNSLCPRCSLFGMTGSGSGEDHGGYKGRFKASTLIGQTTLKTSNENVQIPIDTNGKKEKVAITTLLNESKQVVCKQYLLPIQGQPKPNKRDVNGYFDKNSGEIKGAKYYLHAKCNIDTLVSETNNLKNMPGSDLEYTHKLRNFAQVLTAKENFTGTIGAKSCSLDEISALITILHTPIANYGFKIGIGKAFGMGSMMSLITKIWIRVRDYQWQCFNSVEDFLQAKQQIKANLETFKRVIQISQTLQSQDKTFKVPDVKLQYPMPVQEIGGRKRYYWQLFNGK